MSDYHSFGVSNLMDELGTKLLANLLEKNGFGVKLYPYGESLENKKNQLRGIDCDLILPGKKPIHCDLKFGGMDYGTFIIELISSYNAENGKVSIRPGWLYTSESTCIIYANFVNFQKNEMVFSKAHIVYLNDLRDFIKELLKHCIGDEVAIKNGVIHPTIEKLCKYSGVSKTNNIYDEDKDDMEKYGFINTLECGNFLVLKNRNYNSLAFCVNRDYFLSKYKSRELSLT